MIDPAIIDMISYYLCRAVTPLSLEKEALNAQNILLISLIQFAFTHIIFFSSIWACLFLCDRFFSVILSHLTILNRHNIFYICIVRSLLIDICIYNVKRMNNIKKEICIHNIYHCFLEWKGSHSLNWLPKIGKREGVNSTFSWGLAYTYSYNCSSILLPQVL